jgi:hypothetical protein
MIEHRPVEHQAVEYKRIEADAPMSVEELTALGNEGWEIIGQAVKIKRKYIHLFKRPKATGPVVERRG